MAKKKITPIVDEEAENPAPEGVAEAKQQSEAKPKRIRRGKKDILVDKLNKLYGGFDAEEVKEALKSAIEAVTALDETAQKFKKKSAKAFSIKRIARFRSKEELEQMMLQLQEAIESKED